MKKSLIFVLIVAVAFATLEPVSSLPVFTGVNAFAITAIRFLIGSLILVPFSIAEVRKKQLKITARDWAVMGALGTLEIAVSMNLLQFAVQVVRDAGKTPANVAIIFCSNSLLTILLSTLILREKFTKRKLLAAVLGAIGLCFCVSFKGSDGWISSLLALLAALMFSLYTVLSKKYAAKFSGVVMTGFSFLIGSVVLIVGLLIAGVDLTANLGVHNLPQLLYLGVVVTGIGYVCYFLAIDAWSMMAASLAFFIKPVLTPFMVWLIKGTAPTDPKLFIAIAFVVAGSVTAVLKPKERS